MHIKKLTLVLILPYSNSRYLGNSVLVCIEGKLIHMVKWFYTPVVETGDVGSIPAVY